MVTPSPSFSPSPGGTVTLAVTTTTARVALLGTQRPDRRVRLRNSGANDLFFIFGDATVTAATTDTPLAAGATEVFDVGADKSNVAAITAVGTATLQATTGF